MMEDKKNHFRLSNKCIFAIRNNIVPPETQNRNDQLLQCNAREMTAKTTIIIFNA